MSTSISMYTDTLPYASTYKYVSLSTYTSMYTSTLTSSSTYILSWFLFLLRLCLLVASMYTSSSTSIVLLLLLKTSVSTSTSIATSMCAFTLTRPSILLELWLVAALRLMHGVAEPPVCDWGTACPRMPR